MDWIQQWQSKFNKQNGVASLVRTGGSRHTGLAALPYRNIQEGWHTEENAAICVRKLIYMAIFLRKEFGQFIFIVMNLKIYSRQSVR